MPKPLNVDRPAVSVLIVAVGGRETARKIKISEGAVLKLRTRRLDGFP